MGRLIDYSQLKKKIMEVVDDPDFDDNIKNENENTWEDVAAPFDDAILMLSDDFLDIIEELWDENKINSITRDGMIEHVKDKFSEALWQWNFLIPAYLA